MAVSLEGFNKWISRGKERGHKYMISVCDTFDYDDYPIYCDSLEELKDECDKHDGKNMQRINEVIYLSTEKEINWLELK